MGNPMKIHATVPESPRKRFSVLLSAALALLIIFTIQDHINKFLSIRTFLLHGYLQSPLAHISPVEIKHQKVAVIIEERPLHNLAALLLHFSTVLGPEWPIILYTTTEEELILADSAPIRRDLLNGKLTIRHIPHVFSAMRQRDNSEFMTLPWLWEDLAPAEHVLMFQADSIICANAILRVDDFLQFDFIGAPIDPYIGEGFHGGFSLRNRQMMFDIVTKWNWMSERNHAMRTGCTDTRVYFEDQWFYKKMMELPEKIDGSPAARLPALRVAKMFSVETMWSGNPLSYHEVEKWHGDKLDTVSQWCPEYRLMTSEILARDEPLRDR